MPKRIVFEYHEVEIALRDIIDSIVNAVNRTLEKAPPELAADILDRGITLTGGGSQLHNIDKILSKETNVAVQIAENPFDCVALGTGKALYNLNLYKEKRTK